MATIYSSMATISVLWHVAQALRPLPKKRRDTCLKQLCDSSTPKVVTSGIAAKLFMATFATTFDKGFDLVARGVKCGLFRRTLGSRVQVSASGDQLFVLGGEHSNLRMIAKMHRTASQRQAIVHMRIPRCMGAGMCIDTWGDIRMHGAQPCAQTCVQVSVQSVPSCVQTCVWTLV